MQGLQVRMAKGQLRLTERAGALAPKELARVKAKGPRGQRERAISSWAQRPRKGEAGERERSAMAKLRQQGLQAHANLKGCERESVTRQSGMARSQRLDSPRASGGTQEESSLKSCLRPRVEKWKIAMEA